MDATINNIFYKIFKKDRTDSDFIANEVLSKYHVTVSYPNTNVSVNQFTNMVLLKPSLNVQFSK